MGRRTRSTCHICTCTCHMHVHVYASSVRAVHASSVRCTRARCVRACARGVACATVHVVCVACVWHLVRVASRACGISCEWRRYRSYRGRGCRTPARSGWAARYRQARARRPASKRRWLKPRPVGSPPEAALSARACRRLPYASASRGQSGAGRWCGPCSRQRAPASDQVCRSSTQSTMILPYLVESHLKKAGTPMARTTTRTTRTLPLRDTLSRLQNIQRTRGLLLNSSLQPLPPLS